MFGLDESRKKQGGGGGGKPRIRFGRTGPRGRAYAKPAKGQVAVVKSKFIKAGNGARPAIRGHLTYIQERERGENEQERNSSTETGKALNGKKCMTRCTRIAVTEQQCTPSS